MNSYLLACRGETLWLLEDARPLAKCIDEGDEIYVLDGNVVFLKTQMPIETLTRRVQEVLGEGNFFLTEIDQASRAGNMVPRFWEWLKRDLLADVA